MNLSESCEQNNESITKSSGFSSFSSLLSSNDHQVPLRTRSSSLPSIPCTIFSSMDSSNFSDNDQSDNHDVEYRSKSVIEKPISHISYQQSSTCVPREFSINEENDENQINEENDVEIKLPNNDQETANTQLMAKEQKRKSG